MPLRHAIFALLLSAIASLAYANQPDTASLNPVKSAQPSASLIKPVILNTHELTSHLKVNGRLLGPQTFLVGNKKTHIVLFRESGQRQYQVTYHITTDPTKKTVNVATSINATVFNPSFQLSDGQKASARIIPDLPAMEVMVSVRKLPLNQPTIPRPDKKR